MDHRAGFALGAWALVQTGIFETREDIQRNDDYCTRTREDIRLRAHAFHVTLGKDFGSRLHHSALLILLHSKVMFSMHFAFSCPDINFRNDTRIRIYV